MITNVSTQFRLSDDDLRLVQEFERKLQIVRDRVNSVVHLYHTACYLVGRPGTSKTFTVKKELEQLEVPWAYRNARMTPMGMFDFIADHPEHILVLDDIGTLFKNEQALQILLAALDGDPGERRLVTYKSKDEDLEVWFTGGIIAISNVALRHDPLARALGSRITSLEHEPSDDEIAAYMRHLALKGYKGLDASECMEVAEFVIEETRGCDQRLDLRHLTKAWDDFRQFKDGRAETPWPELVRTSLHQLLTEATIPMSKQEEIEQQRELAQQLMDKYPGDSKRQLAEWQRITAMGKSLFYTRIRQARKSA
jgi:hypothetical protein